MLSPLHRKRQMPLSCSILCIYVIQHQTLPIINLVFDPLTLTGWFYLKKANDLNYNSVILFDTGTDHTYKENSITMDVQYVMKTAQYIPKFYIYTLHNYFNQKVCFLAKKSKITVVKVSKSAKIRNRYNQVPHLIQDTNGKVTNSQ